MGLLRSSKLRRHIKPPNWVQLEKVIADLVEKSQHDPAGSTTAIIGDSGPKILALTLYSRAEFEAEFGEGLDKVDQQDVCVAIPLPFPFPEPLSKQ